MKLNLDFNLYKETTRLKHWWAEVKKHFTQVQTAHNALEDTVASEKTQLNDEITNRTNADTVLSERELILAYNEDKTDVALYAGDGAGV